MKKALIAFSMILMTTPVYAGGLVSKHSASVQLSVDAARTTASRIGSTFSISGSNIDTTDGTTAGTISTGAVTSGIYSPGAIAATQKTAGEAFSFSASFTQADVIPTSAATTGEIQNFGNMTSNAAGTAGNLAGTIDSLGKMSLTAGGAGTSAIGQFSSDIIIK